MCFAPKISITTAIFEFIVAFWMYYNFPKTVLNKFLTTTIIVLGLYQISEFMLCSNGNAEFWGKFGFIIYTTIPVITLYYTLLLIDHKPYKLIVFAPAIFFIAYSLLQDNFILESTCTSVFVIVRNKLNYPYIRNFPFSIYGTYYFIYLSLSIGIILREIRNVKEKNRKLIFYLIIAGILLATLPPLILIFTIPGLGMKFPSMYCQFAMILTLLSIWGLYIENKSEK